MHAPCTVQICQHFERVSRGGGQNRKQTKNRGRPSGETAKAVIDHIKSIAPQSLLPREDQSPQYHEIPFREKLTCPLCSNIFNRPVELSCGSIVCSECCFKRIQSTSSLSCPCCSGHSLNSSSVQPPSPLLVSLLEDLLILCLKRCGKVVKVHQYENHLSGNCKTHYHLDTQVKLPSQLTLEEVLSKPTTSPATPVEVKAAHHLVRRIMDNGDGPGGQGVLTVRTGGQVSN